jgi:hypothetical protein
MSVVFSGTTQGTFTSTGANQILQVREGVDYIRVYNLTVMGASQTTAVASEFYWQFGFPQNSQIAYFKSNAANAANLVQYTTAGGFSFVNNTISVPGASVAISAVSSATPPVVSTANTSGLSNGSVVRLYNVSGAQQLGGVDFTIGNVITNTSFTLAYGPTIVAGTTGTYRQIPYDPPYFYPPTRVISNISNATQAIVTLTVTHAFTVGQSIRFVIPTVTALAYGMTQLNGVQATIVAINQADVNGYTNTITVNVDTTAFGTFAWPLTADPVHSQAQVVPVGMNSAQAITSGSNYIGDSEVNQGFIGIALKGGAGFPGGANGNLMYWVAGKSFSSGN